MNTLYLTVDEKKLFDALSDGLKEGWEVEAEKQEYTDTKERYKMRLSFLKLSDPTLLDFKEKVQNAKSEEEIKELMEGFDFKGVSQSDLAELFFALGPKDVSILMRLQLAEVKNDKDVEIVAALSNIRHELLKSLTAHFS